MCCVGAVVNGLGFVLYLLLTYSLIEPKLAATICFVGGTSAGFILNRNWSFGDPTCMRQTLPRYVFAYAIAYTVNIVGLYVFVDVFGYLHQIVQLILALIIACGLFVAQKIWIFPSSSQ